MTSSQAIELYRVAGLKPHQAKLLIDVLDSQVPVRHLLCSPPGMGKSFAALSLAKEVARKNNGFRILVIGPSALARMYEQELTRSIPKVQVANVTRRVFRELEALEEQGCSIWPERFAAVLSMDTARQDDVRARLCSVTWDLVIIEEVHLFARSRWTLLKTILSSPTFERVLMSTATPDLKGIASLIKNVPRTDWRGPDLSDWDGRKLLPANSPSFEIVSYERGADEVSLLRAVVSLSRQLAPTTVGKWVKKILLAQAGSSWLALERTVRSLRNSLTHGATEKFLLGGTPSPLKDEEGALESDVETTNVLVAGRRPWITEAKALRSLHRVLDRLESVPRDTKREALEELLKRLQADPRAGRNVCVYCVALATATYLHTALSDRGFRTWLLTGETKHQERARMLAEFQEDGGGVLVATASTLKGIELPQAQVLIHYDAPRSRAELLIRTSRNPVAKSLVFVDQSGVLPDEWAEIGLRFPPTV